MSEATISIDGVNHALSTFPQEVQNLIQALSKAEAQHNDQLFELNKTGIFIQAIRKEAFERAHAHLNPVAEVEEVKAGLTD